MTQTVPDISPLMPMHQDPLLVSHYSAVCNIVLLDCVITASKLHQYNINSLYASDAIVPWILVVIGSGNASLPVQCQAITWTMLTYGQSTH